MDRDLVTFLDACMKVRSEKAARALLDEWAGRLGSEAWWKGEGTGTPGGRVALMLQAHLAGYLAHRGASVAEGLGIRKAKAAGEGKGKEEKPVRVHLDGSDKVSASFRTFNEAERWTFRKLADMCGEGFAIIEDRNLPSCPRIRVEKERAVLMTYGRREAPKATNKASTGGSGPWMRVGQTRSSFSRG